jgi:antitoxin CptB
MTPEPTMTPENTSLSQLRLRCRRGMLELDLIMERYLEHHYESADREEQAQFIALLELQDPELYPLVTGATPAAEKFAALQAKITEPANITT